MTIDDSGKWWVGSQAGDIEAFLHGYASEGYEVSQFRLAKCSCGSDVFRLLADDEEGTAKRICVACAAEHFICDSGEHWEGANPDTCICRECGSETCNIGVGFALYDDEAAIKWLYVGERCAKCHILGCFAGWKIGYEPSLQLMDQV